MYIPFSNLPDSSRIWIFQSDRKLTSNDHHILSDTLRTFTDSWAAHGEQLATSFEILRNHFIVLAADENTAMPSGCSIDKAVRVIQELGALLKIDFFNRNNVAFDRADDIALIPLLQLKAALEKGQWHASSIMFNNLIGTKGELVERWMVPASSTWLKRYLPTETVSS